MAFRIRQGSSTDGPTLMHIEHSCRTAASFLPAALRDPGQIRPRLWRQWVLCHPPFDRHPTRRSVLVAYEHSDVLGFIAVMHDSLYGGYRADIAGLFVLPKYRRLGIGTALLVRGARWLQEDGITRVTADGYARDPSRGFFERMGGVVIARTGEEDDPAAVVTFGFANFKELAARPG
ncbi:MAG TPA: GNAT family N-acetyltransferase [Phycisphaerae bacterium]|jgi:GNAT superfamily N-acetyltransferase|nr:GNAT family N-acetyltransferase [Phycisphaerae bacterium]